jgi:hypothetical protein
MFCLQSPKKNGQVKINFSMQDEETEIIWNKENQVFEFVYGPTEISARKKIQETINKNKENLQYIQLKEILRNINSEDNISAEIKIDFPIPIDNKKVKFRIYDTPGTDSNYGQHKIVIKDALAKQTHSILIFVAAPNKLEGEGNNSLLNYLKEAEKKDSKTSIDIDRSLFVINFADTISPTDRKELQTKEIKNKSHNDFSIKLSDKKLFFTSAKIAYAAKAKKNGIATEDEEYIINHHQDIDNPKYGRYYQQNRIATSELATKYSNERNKEALELAIKRKNNLEVFNICSGLYALESEIIKFGEKYSSAVKTFAIIDSVDKTLSKLKMDLKPLESKNQKTITEIDKDINLLKTTISEGINKIYIEREIDLEDNIQEKTLKELGLLADQNDYRISEIIEEVDKLLKGWFLGFGKVKYNEKSKDKIGNLIISKFDDYNREFFNKKNLILEEIRDGFIKDIQEEIRNNGKLSQEAREYVAEIRTPDLENNIDSEYFKEIYNNSKITGRILFLIKTDLVDKDRFSKQIEEEISNIMEIISNEYEKNFKYSQNEILKKIKSEFSNNIHRYNVLIKAKIQDKEIMEDLKTKINDIAISLKKCQDNLNSSIWRGDNNEK